MLPFSFLFFTFWTVGRIGWFLCFGVVWSVPLSHISFLLTTAFSFFFFARRNSFPSFLCLMSASFPSKQYHPAGTVGQGTFDNSTAAERMIVIIIVLFSLIIFVLTVLISLDV